MLWILLILDFWNNIFGGVFRGLGKQAYFNILNFISYDGICIPLAIILTFFVGSHTMSGESKKGMGQFGIWLGFDIGIVF